MKDYLLMIEDATDRMSHQQLKTVIFDTYHTLNSFATYFEDHAEISGAYITASNILRNKCNEESENIKSENLINKSLFEKIKI